MTSNKKILIISFLSIPLSAGYALVPVLSDIAAVFPGQKGWVQLLITIPAFMMMFSSLLTDQLIKWTSLKTIIIASITIILGAGVSPYWVNNFSYLLGTRVFMGIGVGLLSTVIVSLPVLYFSDSRLRERTIGIQSAFVSAGGVLFNILSGTLAKYNWKYVFLVQLVNVLPLLVAIVFMPKTEYENTKLDVRGKTDIFVRSAIPIAILSFGCILLTCTYPLNLSLFVANAGLGDSQLVGVLTSINSAIGFLIGLFFGKVYSKMKEKTLLLGVILAAFSLLMVRFSPSQGLLLLGSAGFGIGSSFISPALYSMLYQRVQQEEIVLSVALLGIASNVSQFFSPLLINPIASVIGGSNNIEGTRITVAGIMLMMLAFVITIRKIRQT